MEHCSLATRYHGEAAQSWDVRADTQGSPHTQKASHLVSTHRHRCAQYVLTAHTQEWESKQGLPLALVTDLELPH